MKHSIDFILSKKFKGREWSLNGNSYDNLVTHDGLPKPTLEELEAASVELELTDYQGERKLEYEKMGITEHEMIISLWERVVENRPNSSDILQAARESVKQKYPKPE